MIVEALQDEACSGEERLQCALRLVDCAFRHEKAPSLKLQIRTLPGGGSGKTLPEQRTNFSASALLSEDLVEDPAVLEVDFLGSRPAAKYLVDRE